jgi:hypothetical protein
MPRDTTLPVVKGMLDALVLRATSRASMHGFEITEWIEERSGGALELEEAAVYQSLYRLEGRGLCSAGPTGQLHHDLENLTQVRSTHGFTFANESAAHVHRMSSSNLRCSLVE